MNWVFISLLLCAAGQFALCGFSFAFIFSCVGRLLFLLRAGGMVVPFKVSLGLEAAHVFFLLVGVVFATTGVDWGNLLLNVLFCGITSLLYLIDNHFYLYVVVDVEEESQE